MAMQLPQDFKEFLTLLNQSAAKYLIIGGYAVGCHGYPRTTGDIDIWIDTSQSNAAIVISVIQQFGFSGEALTPDLFSVQQKVLRMGVPPVRIEILSQISGVEFSDCYSRRRLFTLDGIEVSLISCADLKTNKKSSGRLKDLMDLENLP